MSCAQALGSNDQHANQPLGARPAGESGVVHMDAQEGQSAERREEMRNVTLPEERRLDKMRSLPPEINKMLDSHEKQYVKSIRRNRRSEIRLERSKEDLEMFNTSGKYPPGVRAFVAPADQVELESCLDEAAADATKVEIVLEKRDFKKRCDGKNTSPVYEAHKSH